jgi:protein SSD1
MASFSFPNMLPNMMAANMMGLNAMNLNMLQQQQQQFQVSNSALWDWLVTSSRP